MKELLGSAEVKKELAIEQPDDELLIEIPFDFSPTNQQLQEGPLMGSKAN